METSVGWPHGEEPGSTGVDPKGVCLAAAQTCTVGNKEGYGALGEGEPLLCSLTGPCLQEVSPSEFYDYFLGLGVGLSW